MKDLESMATAAEQYAVAARVALARKQWNADHPDSTPLSVDDWLARAATAERAFTRLTTVASARTDGPAMALFKRRVDAKVARGMTRHTATSAVVHDDPMLHRRVIQEAN